MTNGERFLKAYNSVDTTLRSVYDIPQNISFSEVVRRTAKFSTVVSSCEYKLVEYSRLRNAIVHQGVREEIIAEPHMDVVEDFERMASLIMTPPKAYDTVAIKKVFTLNGSTKLEKVISLIYQSKYSNIPIIENGRLIGIVNNKLMVETIAKVIGRGESVDEFLAMTEVKTLLCNGFAKEYYIVVGKNVSLTTVLDAFNSNRKLLAVIMTETGDCMEKPIGIVTTANIMDIADILDDYVV